MAKVENHTRYDTCALKALILACEKHLGLRRPRKVIIRYSKKSMLWGHATYAPGGISSGNEGTWCELFLPGDPKLFMFNEFALLVEHELLHNKGLKHKDYGPIDALHCKGPTPAWAVKLEARGVPFRFPVKKLTDPEVRIQRRASKVKDALARWERRLALAKTKVRQYAKRAAYYERQLSPEMTAARAARPPAERKPRLKKLVIRHGYLSRDADGVQRVVLQVSRAVWDEICARIMDVDFDESMADVVAMKQDIRAHHPVERRSFGRFWVRVDDLSVLARELHDMQGFTDAPDRALARAEQEVREFITRTQAATLDNHESPA